MRNLTVTSTVLLLMPHWSALGQSTVPSPARGPQPLYEVTIVSRTTKALNYGYLTAPTRIDFQGTPVLAGAHGEAIVEPKRGATLLKMRFEDVPPPGRFGAQYLAYVVWAISPDGRAQNIGELTVDGSGKARLSTSTPLQTFAMIVTAEPYYAVTQPGDVVVMENVVGRGTVGKVQEVNATYELLPRKAFTYDMGSQPKVTTAPVSKEQYEAITALYQALNAIQIAQSQDADRYAPDQLARARQLYNQARTFPISLSTEIVSMAREATQIAEDSRVIAVKRAEAEKAAEEQRRRGKAEPSAHTEQAVHAVASDESQRARVAASPPEVQPPLAQAEATSPVQVDHSQFLREDPQAQENRRRLFSALRQRYDVVDSSRGLVITLPEQLAHAAALQSNLTPIAAAIRLYKDLHIEVEGHTDVANAVAATEREAERVRASLIGAGISPDIIAGRGYGNTRPRAADRNQNRRVEIVIAGDAIGTLPTWDRTYTIQPSQVRR